MNKIIKSLSVIAFVAAIALAGTQAYFSDTETSVGNTFTAGTIDIDIDGHNPFTGHYDIGDLKPGETGYMNFKIKNVGTNAANISKKLYHFTHTDSVAGTNAGFTCGNVQVSSEPEFLAEGGTFDSSGNCDTNGWSAKDYVQSQIIYDLSVEVYAGDDETGGPIWWQTIYKDSDNKKLTDVYGGGKSVALGMIPAGGHMNVTQSYHFNPNAGNKYQGDGLEFDMEIKADQLSQDEEGMATVTLENKTKTGNEWTINKNDGYQGVLKYSTKGPEFVYSFNGTALLASHSYVLAIGKTPNGSGFDVDTEIATGSTNSNGDISLSGSIDIGKDMTDVKVWLVPTENWTSGSMNWSNWPTCIPNFLWETGLISYDDTDL